MIERLRLCCLELKDVTHLPHPPHRPAMCDDLSGTASVLGSVGRQLAAVCCAVGEWSGGGGFSVETKERILSILSGSPAI